MSIDNRLHAVTTIVDVYASGVVARGTGFFYHVLGDPDEREPEMRPIESIWLVTNRHILMPDSRLPDSASFRLRTFSADAGHNWIEVRLEKEELQHEMFLHRDQGVDVAALKVKAHLDRHFEQGTPLVYSAVSESNFPGANKLNVSAASDVIIVGYPKGFYDEVNKFPIVKSGMVASWWGAHFKGDPVFLIDAKLFPGSSGSLVLSKPVDMVVADGEVFFNTEKQFCLLGIYSGELYDESQKPVEIPGGVFYGRESFNLGVVWYYTAIPEIIANGMTLREHEEGLAVATS